MTKIVHNFNPLTCRKPREDKPPERLLSQAIKGAICSSDKRKYRPKPTLAQLLWPPSRKADDEA
jgi:hypothetical protein